MPKAGKKRMARMNTEEERQATHAKHAAPKEISDDAWYDRAIRFCIYALAVAVPAVFTPAFYTVFSMPKLILLRLLTAIIIVLWGCKIFVEGKVNYRFSWLNVFLLIYGAVSVLNTFLTIAPFTSLYGAENRFVGIFTVLNLLLLPFFVFNFLKEERTIRNFIAASLCTAAAIALYGLMQYQGFFDGIFNWSQNPAERVFGTIGHGNHLGAYLGMNLLLGVFFLPYLKKGEKRWILGVGLSLMAITLFLTASRGALFATVLALLVCGIIAGVKNRAQIGKFLGRLPARIGLIIVFLILIGTLVTGQLQKLPLVERTAGTIEFVRAGNIPDRLSWWLSTFEMIRDRPLLGFGLSTYRDIYNAYRRTDYVAPGPGDMQDLITPEAAHNEYLNIGATQGLAGLAAFLMIVACIFWKLHEKTILCEKIDKDFYLALGIKGALLVYLFQVLVSFGVITTLTFFFLLLGLGAALATPIPAYNAFTLCRPARFTLSLCLIVLCCNFSYFTAKEGIAEYFYKEALVAASTGDMQGAIINYQRTVQALPGEYAYMQAFGDFALKNAGAPGLTADTQNKMLLLAELNYGNAAAINPHHPSVFYNLGITQFMLYKTTGQKSWFQKGVENLEKAVELAVNNPLYPYQAGKAILSLNIDGGGIKAAQYFTQALQIRPGYRDAAQLEKNLSPQAIGQPA